MFSRLGLFPASLGPQPLQLRVDLLVRHIVDGLDLDRALILAGELAPVRVDVAHFLRNSLKHGGHGHIVAAALKGVGRPGQLLDTHSFVRVGNSFLDVVLEARSGIPIALGVIYIAVGRRLGLDIEGVNFPGRFLVRATLTDDAVLIVDPSEGVVLDEAALRERVSKALGSDTELTSEHLTAASIRAIVMRMMNNLKVVYVHNGDPAAALGYCDWMVELVPDNPGELRDRAVLLEQIEAFEAAANDYEKVIALVQDASARRKLRRHVRELRRRVPKTLH